MQGIFELFFLLGFLGLGLGCLSFLCRFLKAGEEAFFLLLRYLQSAAGALDLGDVDAADYDLDFLLDRKQFEYLSVTGKGHDPGTNLGFDDGHLVPAKKLRGLLNHLLRQA